MSSSPPSPASSDPEVAPFHSEVLLLPDGRVLVHNLTPEFARVLGQLGMLDPRTARVASATLSLTSADPAPLGLSPTPPTL